MLRCNELKRLANRRSFQQAVWEGRRKAYDVFRQQVGGHSFPFTSFLINRKGMLTTNYWWRRSHASLHVHHVVFNLNFSCFFFFCVLFSRFCLFSFLFFSVLFFFFFRVEWGEHSTLANAKLKLCFAECALCSFQSDHLFPIILGFSYSCPMP